MGVPPDNQLPLVARCRASNKRVGLQHVDSLNDLADPCGGILDIMLSEVVKNALEVVTDLEREFDPRHPLTRQLLGCQSAWLLAR